MNVSDYIFKFLSDRGVDEIFMVTGGQAMFLIDAVYRSHKFKVTCTHHEQSAGMSADAYGRLQGKPAVALVTAGPGSVNITNGVVGGWTDSSPMIVISGQSDYSFVEYQEKTGIRQYGVQGINIRPLVASVTKYFVTVDDPHKILYYLQKAYYLATTGRPGPVWIDVPIDLQRAGVPNEILPEFEIPAPEVNSLKLIKEQAQKAVGLLAASQRPVLLVGQGVRLAQAEKEFLEAVARLKLPVLTSRLGIDLINSDHEFYVGRPGNYGERAANFAIQNSDLILAVGCRLATPLVGHNYKDFGRNAKKIVVDIDPKELAKPGPQIELKIQSDAKVFLKELIAGLGDKVNFNFDPWVRRCAAWKKKYPVTLPAYSQEKPVNSYYFMDKLSQAATAEDLIMVDTGSCFHVAAQAWKVKPKQRFLTTGGLSSMGYWAAGIGACAAHDRKKTIVITGDGSLQMNLQEFATIKHYNLPLKVFILNNNGYLLIRHTQKNFMAGRLLGEGPKTGVWCPDALKIAAAYGLKAVRIERPEEVEAKIAEVLAGNEPVICDVMTPEWQLIIPRVTSEKGPDGKLIARPYEDMYPFLEREEFNKNMIVPPAGS